MSYARIGEAFDVDRWPLLLTGAIVAASFRRIDLKLIRRLVCRSVYLFYVLLGGAFHFVGTSFAPLDHRAVVFSVGASSSPRVFFCQTFSLTVAHDFMVQWIRLLLDFVSGPSLCTFTDLSEFSA